MNPSISTPKEKHFHPEVILAPSVLVLLGLNFSLGYVSHTFFSNSLLQVQSPGFWLFIATSLLLTGIVWLNKKVLGWSWREMGLGKPKKWWHPVLVTLCLSGVVYLFMAYATPFIMQLGERPNIDHLMPLRGNFSLLILSLVMVWITAAFLEELIFRAYLINALDKLFGSTLASAEIAVFVSAVIFGLLHAYQGLTGILITGSLGFIFGMFFLLNGRRIWPLVLVHGLIDTISFIHIYNM